MQNFFLDDERGHIKAITTTVYERPDKGIKKRTVTKFNFNKKGEMTYEFYSSSGEVLADDCFKREGNRLVEVLCYDKKTAATGRTHEDYRLNKEGRIISHITTEDIFKSEARAEYSDGNLKKYTYKSFMKMSSWEMDYQSFYKYTYDEKGLITNYTEDINNGESVKTYKYIRNEKGELISLNSEDKEGNCTIVDMKYSQHDKKGNWLLRESSDKKTFCERSIVYW